MKASVIALLISASPLAAQELVFSPAATETCLSEKSADADSTLCVGASANACMEATQSGWSTVGMSGCYEKEWQYWDGRLNAAYRDVRASAKAIDAEMADLGSAAASQADALRDMQRAWIGFRDATCAYEYTQWGGGSGGGPASISCHMYMTAKQTFYLEAAGLAQ